MANAILDGLRAERQQTLDQIDAILDAAGAESRGEQRNQLTEQEQGQITAHRARLTELEPRIEELEAIERNRQAAADARSRLNVGGATVGTEPMTYGRSNPRNSWFLDQIRASKGLDSGEAMQRLQRHREEVEVELRARPAEQLRAMSRVVGVGGTLVPPLYLIDEYVGPLRPGRVVADLCSKMDLPEGTDSINIPRITQGTITGIQSADNAAVATQDMNDAFISAPVNTIAGQTDVSLQLVEQSPVNIDQVLFKDLTADYNRRLDLQVINGSGTSGQHVGLLNVSGITTLAYTQATPTVGGKGQLYANIAQAIGTVANTRFLPATAVVMTPLRWAWVAAASDSNGRPLVAPLGTSGYNALGTQNGGEPAEGAVGSMAGLPVYVDANLPSNLGSGTNQDVVIVARWDDIYLYEGPVKTRMLDQPLSSTLGIRIQLYAYSAFLPSRYPVSIVPVSGTGLVPPSF